MNIVLSYPILFVSEQVVLMPAGAELLGVGYENDAPALFALVNQDNNQISRRIKFYGPGSLVHESAAEYIGSFTLAGNTRTFHAFDGGEC